MWLPVAKTKDPELEVLGLVPGHEYHFRVKAVNKEGESEPLETLAPIIAKDPFCKFKKNNNQLFFLILFYKIKTVKAINYVIFYFDSCSHRSSQPRGYRLEPQLCRTLLEGAKFRWWFSNHWLHYRKARQIQVDFSILTSNYGNNFTTETDKQTMSHN